MINFKVQGVDYRCVHDWDDMQLWKAIELSNVCKECPEVLKNIYQGDTRELTPDDEIKTIPLFAGKVMKCLTDVPQEVIDRIMPEDRMEFFQTYLNKFVIGVMYQPLDYEPTMLKSFELEGETYYIPQDRNILGNLRPMPNETAITFAESADLRIFAKKMEKSEIEVMPNVISIICRLKDEPYDEQTSLDRAHKFERLPMPIVWEVFFYLNECQRTLNSIMETFSKVLESKVKKQQLTAV